MKPIRPGNFGASWSPKGREIMRLKKWRSSHRCPSDRDTHTKIILDRYAIWIGLTIGINHVAKRASTGAG